MGLDAGLGAASSGMPYGQVIRHGQTARAASSTCHCVGGLGAWTLHAAVLNICGRRRYYSRGLFTAPTLCNLDGYTGKGFGTGQQVGPARLHA